MESPASSPPSPKPAAPDRANAVKVENAPTNHAPSVTKIKLPPNQWLSIASWRQLNGNGQVQIRPIAPGGFYELQGSNGVLSIMPGSRVAYWNGLSLGLGFAPRITNGEPRLHSLDLMKNFEPLLIPTAPSNKTGRIVVIDPGHGGEDKGTKCVANGHFEKDYTLDWALRVQSLLTSNGWKVFLTRAKDEDVTLAERVAFAEKVRADLFISLHFNSASPASSRSEHNGLETYCLTPSGMPSNLVRGFPDDATLQFPNNAYDDQNLYYAMRLHQSMVELTQRRDRGVRRARFMGVLRGQNRPAVLLEGGYMSDLEEGRLIASADYRQKLAFAVAKALAE